MGLSLRHILRKNLKKFAARLRPHINLEMLKIHGYGGARSPLWMTHLFLVNLISLKRNNFYRLSTLPALGKLPLLKHLEWCYLP